MTEKTNDTPIDEVKTESTTTEKTPSEPTTEKPAEPSGSEK
jgi:hypothetical protein